MTVHSLDLLLKKAGQKVTMEKHRREEERQIDCFKCVMIDHSRVGPIIRSIRVLCENMANMSVDRKKETKNKKKTRSHLSPHEQAQCHMGLGVVQEEGMCFV